MDPRATGDVWGINPGAERPRIVPPIFTKRLAFSASLDEGTLKELLNAGCLGVCDNTEPVNGEVPDSARIVLLQGFLEGLAAAIADGAADVRSYYLWSLLDNFEWAFGYSKRFGIVHVNYESLERTPKASAHWYSEVIRNNGF